MMEKLCRRCLLPVSLTLFSLAVYAAGELPDREDYAFGFDLITHDDSDYFALDLPLSVYRSVSDSQLRDAGVFNAAGQPVPRQFEHAPPLEKDVETRAPLGLVPLYGEAASHQEQLHLLLRSDADGTTLEYALPADGTETPAADRPLTAYIVDGREQAQAPTALDFHWSGQGDGFIGKITIEDSSDLQAWRTLASGSLADLHYQDTVITQNRVQLPRKPADFIRLRWHDMPPEWTLTGVDGIRSALSTTARRDRVTLEAQSEPGAQNEYVFDVGGFPPVDRINLLLPDENIVVNADIYYWHEDQRGWRRAHSGLFYHIRRQGNDVQSPPASIQDVRARLWKVSIRSGVVSGPARLQLGWHPDRLVFLAQGGGPFELVAGRARDRLDRFPLERVLGDGSIFRMLRESGPAGSASLGQRVDIAGAKQLEIAPVTPWKVALLWLGLGLAVLVVGWMVWSLIREMKEN